MLQFSYTLSRLVVVLVGVIVAALSFFSGAGPHDILLRTGCALLGVGFLLWIANMRLARGAFDALAEDIKAQQEAERIDDGVLSTLEEKV